MYEERCGCKRKAGRLMEGREGGACGFERDAVWFASDGVDDGCDDGRGWTSRPMEPGWIGMMGGNPCSPSSRGTPGLADGAKGDGVAHDAAASLWQG